MKISKLLLMSIVALPLFANADTPTTAPDMSDQQPRRFIYRGFTSRLEWDDMMQFMSQNSPNRARIISEQNIYEDNLPARVSILKKWRDYKFVAEHFPEVAALRVQRFQVEDELFGLQLAARHDPSLIKDMRPQIREKAAELVRLSIQERELRIQKMEKMLTLEKQKLADEQTQQDNLTDQRTDKIMQRLQRRNPTTIPSTPTN